MHYRPPYFIMMEKNLSLTIPSRVLPLFFPLFQKGVLIKILSGSSIRDLIVNNLGISDDYLEERIQTIFLNGKAVDDLQATIVPDGAIMALSAAMPGLAVPRSDGAAPLLPCGRPSR